MPRLTPACVMLLALAALLTGIDSSAAAENDLASQALAILKRDCYSCHGKDGSLEGGMNYVLDRDKLLARKKIIAGEALQSPLYRRVVSGKMPPPGHPTRPSQTEVALLKKWIDAGAPGVGAALRPKLIPESAVFALIREDLETLDRRARRFTRYFSLTHLANQGLSADELQTYRNAVAKLLNSLSWHPRITVPKAIDRSGLILRIDLRDFLWDATLWNRLISEYPYGVLPDSAVARACVLHTATRVPFVRADWFLASASRAPLYYDLLQIPGNLSELERQLRVDPNLNILQERVARAGFNGSGVSRNNRILERHDSVHGAYWRTYDFEAVPQNLIERDILLPDRRNIFAYPLGPGGTADTFQHAGGEVIFNLPNGLQGYMLVNAENNRLDKGPTAIVSDPRRPDRAVEAGVSCMSCHYTGILPKDDQIRDHVRKNAKAFPRKEAELVRALYPEKEKLRKLMEEDAERFRKAVAKTGDRISATESISTLTLRYEADVDLATLAAEVGVRAEDLLEKVISGENAVRNLGSLKVAGGTVSRSVVQQAYGDIARALRLGTVLQVGATGESLPDVTGERDPLESQSSPANGMVFSADGRLALFASADKSIRLFDVEQGRDLRRFIGHTASVWCVAFSPDQKLAASGGVDQTVRIWEVESGREKRKFEGHEGLVLCLAWSPDGKHILSAGIDHSLLLWEVETGKIVRRLDDQANFVNALAFSPDGELAAVADDRLVLILDLRTGKIRRTLDGHTAAVTCLAWSAEGKSLLSGGDDGSARLWQVSSGRIERSYLGHQGPVKCLAFSPDGRTLLTGGADQTLRLWELSSGKELKKFTRHSETLVAGRFSPDGQSTLSGSRDAAVLTWPLVRKGSTPPPEKDPPTVTPEEPRKELRPVRVLSIEGTVGSLNLSANGRWLYVHAGDRLKRWDAQAERWAGELELPAGTETVQLSPDGKVLLAFAPGKTSARVQVIDAAKWSMGKAWTVAGAYFDAVLDDRDRAYLGGGRGEWTDVAVLDLATGRVLNRLGGVWARSFLRLSADQKRLYHATQGVNPSSLEALVLPEDRQEKPRAYRSPARGKLPLGGEFVVTTDGKFLVSKSGTVLKSSADAEEDLTPAATVEPFLASALAPERGLALFCTEQGTLRQYSYPDFRLRAIYRLPGVGYQAALDTRSATLYIATFDPRSLTARGSRPRGEIAVFAFKNLETAKP